jgi:beta-lactam-binding protein with PASTA domain
MTYVTEGLPETQFPPEPDNIDDYLTPPKTQIPTVVSLTEEEAIDVLHEANLNAKVVEVASLEPVGIVVAQSIEPGTEVTRGTTVNISVSTGEIPVAPMPGLIGRTFENALEVVSRFQERTNVKLALVKKDIEVANPNHVGIIVRTDPEPDTLITGSATVLVYVGVPKNHGGGG